MEQFLNWKQTRTGLFVSGVVEAILTYIFASLAIDSGSLWYYLLTFIFLIGAIVSLIKAIKFHDKR